MPLLNMKVVCGDVDPVVVSVCDCTEHMSEGGKNDATYIAEMFQEKVNELDPKGRHTDVFFFDGAANVKKVGQILHQTFPRAYCFHWGEHVLSLFFSDLSKQKQIQVRQSQLFLCHMLTSFQSLVLKACRLYNVFGSDANHGIHAQFMIQASAINNGKGIGLFRGAKTRFVTWFLPSTVCSVK